MKFERELLKGVAPVVVLEILCRGEMYGYELSEAISQRSGEILTLGKGTLYPLLYNLEAKGLVVAENRIAENGRKRRYYSITSKGKSQLTSQKEQWQELQKGVEMVFGFGVERRSGLIENDHTGVGDDHSGNRYTLALAARQAHAVAADDSIQAGIQFGNRVF